MGPRLSAVRPLALVGSLVGLGLLALLALGVAPARAQTSSALVSNLGQSFCCSTGLASWHVAQAFTTGSETRGYTLTDVDIPLAGGPSGLSVKIVTGSTSGTTLATLTNPTSLTNGTNKFTAPANTTLAASTTYFVIVEGSAGTMKSGETHTEDAGAAAGFSIANISWTRAASSSGSWSSSNHVRALAINGTAPGPEVSSATLDGATLEVVFDKNLDSNSVPAASAVLVTSRAERILVLGRAVADATLTLTLELAPGAQETILLYYTQPSANPLQDANGHPVASFSRQAVTNNNGSGTPAITGVELVSKPRHDADGDNTNETYPVDQPIVVDVTWDEDVTWNTSATEAELRVSLTVGSNTRNATLVTGGATSGTASTLRFSYTVVSEDTDTDGVAVGGGGTSSSDALVVLHSGATLKNAKGTQNAGLTHAGLAADADHQVKGSVAAVANSAPTYSGTTPTEPQNAPPQTGVNATRLERDFSDADGDTLTFTVSADPAYVPELNGLVYRSDLINGFLSFRARAHCVLANLDTAPTSPLITTFTLTATDPDGDSVSTTRQFRTTFHCAALTSAEVNGRTLALTFDRAPLNFIPTYAPSDETPTASEFMVTVGGTPVALADEDAVALSDPMASEHTITLTLAERVAAGDAVTVTYAPGDYPVAKAFANQSVTNNTVDSRPTMEVDPNDGTRITLTFGTDLAALDAATLRGLEYAFFIQGGYYEGAEVRNQGPNQVAVSGKTVTLTLGAGVPIDKAATVGYHGHAQGLRLTDGHVVESFTVVATRTGTRSEPLLTEAQVEGTTLTLTFDQELDSGSAPAGSRFNINFFGSTINGTGTAVVSGKRAAITLASTVPHSRLGRRGLWVWYVQDDDANPLRAASSGPKVADIWGFRADGLRQRAPSLDSAVVAGTKLTLYYDEDLDTGSTPATSDFTVTVGGSGRTVSGVAVSETAVTLTLASSVSSGASVTVAYTKGTNPIQDVAGTDAANLSSRSVTNAGPTDSGAPALAATSPASAAGWVLTLSFDKPLDPTNVPHKSAFTLSNPVWSVHSVTVRGQKVELVLSWAVNPCSGFTVSYAKPTDSALRNLHSTEAASFSDQGVTYGGSGQCVHGMANSWTGSVVLRSTRPFAQDAPPQAAWFTVSASGGPVTVNGAAFDQDDPRLLVLTLSREFTADETISVSYTRPPGQRGLWNVDGNQLANVTNMPVENRVGAAPSVTGVALTSDAGGDDTYALGEVIRVRLTFSKPVAVDTTDGTPSLTIDMDPAYWGAKWAVYESGSGSSELVFAHTVAEPNYSTRGIAVLADTLRLNGGTIRSAASETDADLDHDGLDHDPEHRVDWRLPPTQSTPGVNQAPVFVGRPPGRVNAPPTTLVSLPASQADFRDPDGDALTFTLSAVRAGVTVAGYPAYSEATGRIFFMANTECALAALDPPLPETFDTLVTMTATDLDGASAQVTATFRTGRADFVCPSLSGATADGATVTLAFDADLGYSYAQPTAGEFVVQAGGVALGVAAATVSEDTISLTLASPVQGGQAVSVSYVPGDTPAAAAFSERTAVNETPTPSVTGVEIASDDEDDEASDTYGAGDVIRIRVTFSEAVEVDTTGGDPRLQIDMDPANWGQKWAVYEDGSGTTTLTFVHEVVEPNLSTEGVAVLADTLELDGGAIRSAASRTNADLTHDGLDHDPKHRVDWRS
ncbi:MAG: SwmB domain-containing protein [Chloroflexi bacterium]|nr:SwmB domain-containing protein [Chloroflexota bacterium]MCY3697120.1 SwmB domain-containing protein [Chloroflexota bacterium]